MIPRTSLHAGAWLICSSLASAQTTAEYPLVDQVGGTMILTNAAPIRPMVWDGPSTLWAVNTSLGTVERFDVSGSGPFDSGPAETIPVPWGPVSIAVWTDTGGGKLVVACRNSWGLLVMNATTGAYERWVDLPAEPTDLVVDGPAESAWVSCMGGDAVVRVDLADGSTTIYDEGSTSNALRLKSPFFLTLEADGTVLVAPLHSGNNTTVIPSNEIVSLAEIPLPDEDLFRIDPTAQIASSVTVVSRGAGTSLFAHARNPHDGSLWLLNTDARNAQAVGEPALGFDLVDTRAAVLSSSHVAGDPPANQWILDQDGSGFGVSTAVGQGFALAFHPSENWACIAGQLTDNVVIIGPTGVLLHEEELPDDGAIPRGLAFRPGTSQLFVYCWGTSEIRAYTIQSPGPTVTEDGRFTLSHDALTSELQLGREIFFDGHRSNRENISCASCHLDAGTDFLAWNLSGLPFDNKGPMVTQTLIGLERVSPFHWRGERTLEDFNTFAFPGLLGDAPLSPTDFEAFRSYLFALRNPANPFQARTRKVTDAVGFFSTGPGPVPDFGPGDAPNGLSRFQNDVAFEGRWRCVECHAFPVGTNNDVFSVFGGSLPEQTHFKNTPFHELWRKKASLVLTQQLSSTGLLLRNFLGVGARHDGIPGDILRFFQGVQPVSGIDPDGFLEDVSAFMQQWDQGMGQAVHFAYLLTDQSQDVTEELEDYLLLQASRLSSSDIATGTIPNCDICIFGTVPGTSTRAAWFLDRSLAGVGKIATDEAVFVENTDTNPSVLSLDDFIADAENHPALFVGLPFGMAERYAVDADMDGIRDRDEASGQRFVSNPDPTDTTPPQILAAEILWISCNTARLFVETDEPTTLSVAYGEDGQPQTQSADSPLLSRIHLLLLGGLRPSTENRFDAIMPEDVLHDYTITATDGALAPNSSVDSGTTPDPTDAFTLPLDEAATGGNAFEVLREAHIVDETLTMSLTAPSGGVVTGSVTLSAALKQGTGQATNDRFFVVKLFRQVGGAGAPVPITSGQLRAGSATHAAKTVRITSGGTPLPLAVTGPFLVNQNGTPASGNRTLHFKLLSPVTTGDTIIAVVESVVEASGASVSGPDGGDSGDDIGGSGAISNRGENPPPPGGGGLIPPWDLLDLAVSTLEAYTQWDFPRTTEHRFLVEMTVP